MQVGIMDAFVKRPSTRRRFLQGAAILSGMVVTSRGWADDSVNLDLRGGPTHRDLTTAFPQKRAMILQRTRPPLLETPLEVFDRGVFTPNDQFFVRWHWAVIPQRIDVTTFRVSVHGHVNNPLSLSLTDIMAMPRVDLAAVNQCSGNSRGYFQPRVAGGQWSNGAMGNARWTGVRLRDVLDHAGVKTGAVQVRFHGLETPVVDGAPYFEKSLDIDHARDGEVMIAYQMNGDSLPVLNGFPIRLIVPGRYSTYWVKMLNDIEVLDQPDTHFWMKTAYLVPDNHFGNAKPGETGIKMVPISRMLPRSFFTNVTNETTVRSGAPVPLRGIAFGGDCGVSGVEVSADGGKSWKKTVLGNDEGPYSFRQWSIQVTAPQSGALVLQVRCTNTKGEVQPEGPNWNSGGYMRNAIEHVQLKIA